MWFIWGTTSGERDLGYVAEQCIRCGIVAPCRVSGLVEGLHVFFVEMAAGVTHAACSCGLCGGQFPVETWRYKEFVPAAQAISLSTADLLKRSNPALKDRLDWSRRLEEFAADPRFEEALRSLDELPPSDLVARLRGDLRRWDALDEGRREGLAREVDESARAIRFARSIAPTIPDTAGCLIALLACLAVWAGSLLMPDLGLETLWWGVGVGVAGLIAGAQVYQLILGRRVRRWTREVLIPEGRKSGVDFRRFVDLLEDLPPGPRTENAFRHLQEQASTIRGELAGFEAKGPAGGADPDAC